MDKLGVDFPCPNAIVSYLDPESLLAAETCFPALRPAIQQQWVRYDETIIADFRSKAEEVKERVVRFHRCAEEAKNSASEHPRWAYPNDDPTCLEIFVRFSQRNSVLWQGFAPTSPCGPHLSWGYHGMYLRLDKWSSFSRREMSAEAAIMDDFPELRDWASQLTWDRGGVHFVGRDGLGRGELHRTLKDILKDVTLTVVKYSLLGAKVIYSSRGLYGWINEDYVVRQFWTPMNMSDEPETCCTAFFEPDHMSVFKQFALFVMKKSDLEEEFPRNRWNLLRSNPQL